MWECPTHCGHYHLWASGPEFCKKAEQFTESSSVSNISLWSFLQFLPWVQALTSLYYNVINQFVLQIVFGHCVYHRQRKQTKRITYKTPPPELHIVLLFFQSWKCESRPAIWFQIYCFHVLIFFPEKNIFFNFNNNNLA